MTVVTRTPSAPGQIQWDAVHLGRWAESLEANEVVINLAGRRVHCRYNPENLREMMDSRVDSTRILGEAIGLCKNPPRVWLQASTATIYAHRFDAANEEPTGIIGGNEPGAPAVWNYSIEIAKAWERELANAVTPATRKVAMRSAIVMATDKDGAFEIFCGLARKGLGGKLGGGKQFVSWIHEADFCRSIDFLIERPEFDGPVNLCSPNPLIQSEFARALREALHVPFGLPAARWMVDLGTWVMNADSELVMKSRRVVPMRMLQAGFEFRFPTWAEAAKDLVATMGSA